VLPAAGQAILRPALSTASYRGVASPVIRFGIDFSAAVSAAGDAAIMTTPLKAFLVEDSPVIRESLVAALEELAPVEVVGTAPDERSAVQWLSDRGGPADCDLVIVDIFLKSGSGLGVLRAAHELHRKWTMVVLSNYATADMQRRCLDLGASRVFDKSADLDELIGYCEQLAQRS